MCSLVEPSAVFRRTTAWWKCNLQRGRQGLCGLVGHQFKFHVSVTFSFLFEESTYIYFISRYSFVPLDQTLAQKQGPIQTMIDMLVNEVNIN